jgi:hypothetical protein
VSEEDGSAATGDGARQAAAKEGVGVLIDCDHCRVRDLACRDCVVPVLLAGRGDAGPGDHPLDLDGPERAAIAVLARSGLVPPLRLVPDEGPAAAPRRAAG